MSRTPSCDAGLTLVELVIGVVLLGVIGLALGAALATQADVAGQVTDDDNTFLPAHACLQRIRTELKSAVRSPSGLEPFYGVSETSITFRPAAGFAEATDPTFLEQLFAENLASESHIVYAPFTKTISYDAAAKTVTLSYLDVPGSGAPPDDVLTAFLSGILALLGGGSPTASANRTEVLATGVESFAFFDGESQASPPAAADATTWVIGVRMEVARPSAAPGVNGAVARSSRAGVVLSTKVRIQPETLVNSRPRPSVGS